jgi:hypothetical protein
MSRSPLVPCGAGNWADFAPKDLDACGDQYPGTPGADPLGLRVRSWCTNPNALPYGGLILGSAALGGAENGRTAPTGSGPPNYLIRFPALLLAQSLPRKRFLGPALLAGLHIEAVLLDFLDDVFLLHFALETSQGIFQRLILLYDDFGHVMNSPPIRFGLVSCGASRRVNFSRLDTSVGTAPVSDYRMVWPLRGCTLEYRWPLLINSRALSQEIFTISRGKWRY